MKRFVYFYFTFFYGWMLLIYFLQPIVILAIAFIPLNNKDIVEFNQTMPLLIGILCCSEYVLAIIPTISYFHMNKGKEYKRYWYNDVFDRKKVYGNIRKILLANAFLFAGAEIVTIAFRILHHQSLFPSFFWMPFVSFLISFGVTALESGVYLDLHKAFSNAHGEGSQYR